MSDDSTNEATNGPSTPGIFDFDPPPEIDPNKFGPVPIVSIDSPLAAPAEPVTPEPVRFDLGSFEPVADLPHWTEPATGQVPKAIAVSGDDDWNDLSGPRWHGEGPEWAGDDLEVVLGDGGERRVVIDDTLAAPVILAEPSAGDPQRSRPRRPERAAPRTAPSGERNIPQAIGVGLAIAALALLAFRWDGVVPALALITLVVVLAAVEVFNTMRIAGSHPASLLGIVACGALPVVVYHRGEAAFAMVLALAVVFGALWYLVGADSQRPALNLGLTFLGIGWIGVLGAFAGLLLRMDDGKSIVVAAIVATAIYDTGALAGGSLVGANGHKFHPASPSKTWEGTVTGVVLAIIAGAVLGIYNISPMSEQLLHMIYLGLVVGVLAPIGDLTESLVKRDLGVKDMGTLLPGHGGVLDRVDGLLFVLPGVYYLALILGYA